MSSTPGASCCPPTTSSSVCGSSPPATDVVSGVGHVAADAAEPDEFARRSDRGFGPRRQGPAGAVAVLDRIVDVDGATGGDGALQRVAYLRPILGHDAPEMRLDRALELEGINPVDAMELRAPLHGAGGHVPEPPADVREGLALLQSRLGLREQLLRHPLLGGVERDRHCA